VVTHWQIRDLYELIDLMILTALVPRTVFQQFLTRTYNKAIIANKRQQHASTKNTVTSNTMLMLLC